MSLARSTFREPSRRVAWVIYGLAAVWTAGWLPTIPYIFKRTELGGDGFEWVIQGPFAYVFLLLVLPAIFLARSGRRPAWIPVSLALVGLVAEAALWHALLTELR